MNKKKIFGALIGLTILIVCISAFVLKNNTEEAAAQQKKDNEYLTAAAHFYNDIDYFEFFSQTVLSGYSTTWSEAIDNHEDFNVAIATKKTESSTMIDNVTWLYEEMGKRLKTVSEAAKEQPGTYKEVYEEYKTIYGIVTALKEQVESPSGSLISFNQNVNSLIQEYKKAKANIYIAVSNDIKAEAEKIKEENADNSKNN
ncbi:hypothetical protein COE51_01095 [Bacillus pseudomycoides]|nr:hypothetical protein COE51_01095 [Bacillus pseudomycoides]